MAHHLILKLAAPRPQEVVAIEMPSSIAAFAAHDERLALL